MAMRSALYAALPSWAQERMFEWTTPGGELPACLAVDNSDVPLYPDAAPWYVEDPADQNTMATFEHILQAMRENLLDRVDNEDAIEEWQDISQDEPLKEYFPRYKRVAKAAKMRQDDSHNIRHFLSSLATSIKPKVKAEQMQSMRAAMLGRDFDTLQEAYDPARNHERKLLAVAKSIGLNTYMHATARGWMIVIAAILSGATTSLEPWAPSSANAT